MQDDEDNDDNDEEQTNDQNNRRGCSRSRNRRRQANQVWCTWQCEIERADENETADELLLKQSTSKYGRLKTKFLLDTGSTINATIMNEDLVTNVRVSDKPIVMATNAGMKKMNLDADVNGFGTGKFDPDQMANILGFSHMSEKYRYL